ncbi:MAG TPA: DUF817 domain-containing protein [Caulobacteraceae bacterium]|jgi:uncharacterized membrane protein YoaT (DUF817 family)
MSLKDRIKGAVAAMDRTLQPWAQRSRANAFAYEFLLFGLKQSWAAIFGGAMLALIIGTHFLWPRQAPIARYDFLVVAAIAVQMLLLWTGLERWYEALVILVFHAVGTAMEVFKTAHGSSIYPEPSLLRIGGVPLFSGFMYACVGSYMARAIRLFEIRFIDFPPTWAPWLLALMAYANFFTHHFMPDARLGLFAFSALIFRRTEFEFMPHRRPRRMPLLQGAILVSLFIWIAENLGTFAGAWIYPAQRYAWAMVPFAKLGSWYLLMLLSFALVTLVHPPNTARSESRASTKRAAETSPSLAA